MILIQVVDATRTHRLRRIVLRDGLADESVEKAADANPQAIHLLAVLSAAEAGVVSCIPDPLPGDERSAWRLYQMGVDASYHRQGVGSHLVNELLQRLRAAGVEIVWAHARDSALPFYQAAGFTVQGEQYQGWRGIPHHTVVLAL